MQSLVKLIRIRPGEGSRVALLAAQYFCVVAVTIAAKSARDTYFLSRYDRSYLPLMFVACAAVVAVLASVYARATGLLGRNTLTSLCYALFIGVLLLMQPRVEGFVVPSLYVWVEVVISIVTLQFWMQAADLFDARQAKRLFALIGAGGSLAAFLVGMSLKPYVKAFGSGSLLFFVAGGLAASWFLGQWASRFAPQAPRRSAAAHKESAKPKLDRYLIAIALIVGLSAMVTQIVDYQFKIAAGRAMADEAELASFFGRFYAATGVASLLMQLFFTSAILNRFGLRGGLLTLPVFLGCSAAGFLTLPGLIAASAAKFSDQTFKFTLHNSSLELLWLPVSAARRRALKPVVGGAFKAGAEAFAGLLMFFLVKQFDFRFLSLLSLTAVAVWLAVCLQVARLYVHALAGAIERHEVDLSGLELDVHDPSFHRTLTRELDHPDLLHRLFALELMEGLPLEPWADRLRQLLEQGTPEEQSRILQLARNDTAIVPDELILRLIDRPGPLSAEIAETAAARRLATALPGFERRLAADEPVSQARAAAAILQIRALPHEPALTLLTRLASAGSGAAQAIAIEQLAGDLERLPSARLHALLAEAAPETRNAAASVAARRQDQDALPALLANLSDARTASAALEALAAFPAELVARSLQSVLESDPPSPHRAGVLRAYRDLPIPDAAAHLLRYLSALQPAEARSAAASLLALARRNELPAPTAPELQQAAGYLSRNAFRSVRMLRWLPESPESALVRDHYENQVRQSVPSLLLLGSLATPQAPVEQCVRTYEGRDSARLPFVLEFVDSSFRPEDRARVVPLLEAQSWSEKDEAGQRLFEDLPRTLEEAIQDRVRSGDPWESAVLTHYLARSGAGVDSNHPMYSTLEKTILLKSVSLFREIPAETLSRIASIAEERNVPAGTLILREGDFGESLFVVASGSVRIHRGEQEFTVFHRGDCLGEMALLDGAPRSASATALEDTTLLEIDQPSFYQVTEEHPAIMREIVRLLTRRLREANDKIAAKS